MKTFLKFYSLVLFVVGLFFWLSDVGAKSAFASCSGGWTCGTMQTFCEPSGCSDYYCDNHMGACDDVERCDDNSVPFSCSGSTQYACENDGHCGAGYCSGPNSVSCSWYEPSAPTSTPTPIPPTPTPQPGCSCYYNQCMGSVCQQGIPCPNCVFPGNGCSTSSDCGITPTPLMTHCSRCSTVNGCEWTDFWDYQTDCAVPDSTVTRSTNCNCPAISGKDNSRCSVCAANCKNITGPSEVVVNNTYTYTATFEAGKLGAAPLTDCALAVLRENSCPSNIYYFWSKSACAAGTRSYTWTPSTTGYFDMECRAWNDGNAECRGKCSSGPPIYACDGPTAYKTIHVVLPTSTPTPANTPPSAPTLSSPANGSTCQNTTLTLSWSGVSSWGACRPTQNNRYLIYVDNNSDFSSPVVNGTSTTSTFYSASLSAGVTYYWKILANNGCLSTSSSTWSFSTKGNIPANPTCTGSCSVASAPEANVACAIDWNDISGTSYYAVRLNDGVNGWSGDCSSMYTGDYCKNVSSSADSFTGKGGHSYEAWVHSVDSCNQWSPSPVHCYFSALACPAVPSNLTATRSGCDVTLKWTDNSTNETGFVIRRALNGGAFSDLKTVGAGVTGTTDLNVFCGSGAATSAQYQVSALYSTCPRVYATSNTISCPLTVNLNPPSPSSVSITTGQTLNPAFAYSGSFECGAFNRVTVVEVPTTPPGNLLDEVTDVHTVQGNNFSGTVELKAKTNQTGATIVRVTVYLNPGDIEAGHIDVPVNVMAPEPWWQTTDGDVHTDDNLTCLIPDLVVSGDAYISLRGDGGSPGVVSHGGSLSFGDGDVSEDRWQANTTYHEDEVGFDYLMNRLNVDTSKTLPAQDIPNGNGTYYSAGSVNLNGRNVNNDKVIIFINGDVTVISDIRVGNSGFFALIAKGNITFDDAVTEAQGFYLADGTLTVAEGGDLFEGQGSFIGWGGVSLKRDLGAGNIDPASTFLFRPDLLVNAPKEFLFTPFVFQEVAP